MWLFYGLTIFSWTLSGQSHQSVHASELIVKQRSVCDNQVVIFERDADGDDLLLLRCNT